MTVAAATVRGRAGRAGGVGATLAELTVCVDRETTAAALAAGWLVVGVGSVARTDAVGAGDAAEMGSVASVAVTGTMISTDAAAAVTTSALRRVAHRLNVLLSTRTSRWGAMAKGLGRPRQRES